MAYDLTVTGIVVAELALNDNDKLLTIITNKRGKMTVLAKGIKSIKSKRSAGAQLFCYSEFFFIKREERYWLDAIEVIEPFQGISEDVEALALASYFAEVADKVCMEDNDEQQMQKLVLNCIYALAYRKDKPKWMIKAVFELQCMCIQGFAPNFENCALCGSEIKTLPKNILFELQEGGFVCDRCSSTEDFTLSKDGYSVKRDTYEAIKYICKAPQNRMLAFTIPDNCVAEFRNIAEQYIKVQTERTYNTLEYYNKHFAAQ